MVWTPTNHFRTLNYYRVYKWDSKANKASCPKANEADCIARAAQKRKEFRASCQASNHNQRRRRQTKETGVQISQQSVEALGKAIASHISVGTNSIA